MRCRRCAGQLLRSFPDLEPTCLLCGWYPVEIPAWVQAEYEERLGSDELDGRRRNGRAMGRAPSHGKMRL